MNYKQLYISFNKHIFGVALLVMLQMGLATHAKAQNNGCNGVRYLLDIFPNVTTTTVNFGAATTMANIPQTLAMDIFQPSGDTLSRRPVIIWVFGGAFVAGTRQTMHDLCRTYAMRGYVTAAIDYRLYPLFLGALDSTKLTTISIQAMHDLKAAVRYMRRYANLYKVDTTNIIAGGVSAGAITSLLVGHLDSTDNIPTWTRNLIAQQGGMEGTSGNAGFSSSVKAVINLSGSLPTTAWLGADDVPTMSYHGTNDAVVPFDCSTGLFNFSSCGSAAISRRLTAVGVPNMFYAVPNGGHEDVYLSTGAFASHLNAFSLRATVYLKQIICNERLTVDNQEVSEANPILKAFPNPAQNQMWITWQSEKMPFTEGGELEVIVTNALGGVVFSQVCAVQSEGVWLQKANCGNGFFVVTLRQNGKIVAHQKIIFN